MTMIKNFLFRWPQALALSLLLLAAGTALADPPGRVARLAYIGGDVSFAPAGEDSWYDAHLNRPLITGDRLWTGRGGRVELQLGGAAIRLDRNTSFEFLNLDDALAQIQLTEGAVNLRVDYLHQGQVYEIDTPTLAFVINEPGEYRLDVSATTMSTQVTIFDGSAEIYGEHNRSQRLFAGSSTRFYDPGLRDMERLAMPRPDDFDRWAFARNERYLRSPSRQYVSTELIGYADLDDHGSWRHVADYGHVWFPRRVAAGWAPYRDGHWTWIEPWGWTWVDNAPWGFAPSHYGRWVYVSSGWGWLPGPRNVRPVYAPALVAFVGGSNWSVSVSSGPPIGWFPLGPRDVYVPWYRSSRDYFGRVNVHNTTIINNTYVTNIYNDYYVQGRPLRRDFTFRGAANAVTVVPRDSFVSAQNAAEAMARSRLRPGQLGEAELLTRAPVAPTRDSLAGSASRNIAPPARSFDRGVIARTKPAEQVAPFEVRQRAIVRNGGEPLAADQMRRINAEAGNPRARNVDVIGQPRNTADRSTAGAARDRAQAESVRERSAVAADRNAGTDARGTSRSSSESQRAPAATTAPERNGRALPSSDYSRSRSPTGSGRQTPRAQPAEGIPLPRSNAPSTRSQGNAPAAREAQPGRSVVPANRERAIAPARDAQSTPPALAPRTTAPARDNSARAPQAAPAQRDAMPRQAAPARQASPAPRVQSGTPVPPAQRSMERTQRSAPMQRSTPEPVQRSAPAPVQRSTPMPNERSAPPQRSERAAPSAPQRSTNAPARDGDSGRSDNRSRERARER